MGKKSKGLSSRGSAVDLHDDVSTSSCSTWATAEAHFACQEEYHDQLSEAIDQLTEKRRETREKALANLITYLREDVRTDDLVQNETTIIGRCINLIRRGGTTEALLAAQLLGLHLISLPEQQESQFREAQFDLQRSAIFGTSTEIMDKLQGLWRTGDSRVAAAALRGWSLLFTHSNVRSILLGERMEDTLRQLAGLLYAHDVEVGDVQTVSPSGWKLRSAAGECLALAYHYSRNALGILERLMEDEEYETCEEDQHDENHGEGQVGGEEETGGEEAQVVGRLRKLAVAHPTTDTMRRSTKDRAAMKATFRGVLATIEKGVVPSTKIKLQKGDVLVVDTMEGNVQLNAVRKYLAGGFQVHMQYNPLFHAMFNFSPREEAAPRLTATEKRLYKSPSSADSKWRTAERKGDRAYKMSRQAQIE